MSSGETDIRYVRSGGVAIAYQIALSEHHVLIAQLVPRAAPPDQPTRTLLTVSLANYLAGEVHS